MVTIAIVHKCTILHPCGFFLLKLCKISHFFHFAQLCINCAINKTKFRSISQNQSTPSKRYLNTEANSPVLFLKQCKNDSATMLSFWLLIGASLFACRCQRKIKLMWCCIYPKWIPQGKQYRKYIQQWYNYIDPHHPFSQHLRSVAAAEHVQGLPPLH